ncbi:hypothetical protein Sjap_007811 [Stephania japonica]|uniref:Uncharacterized protein n=1 Tax=Stephania japonica TaxID=461633 RepID=A0AAP0JNE9_9MAGN
MLVSKENYSAEEEMERSSQEQDRLIEVVSDEKGGLRTLPFIIVVDCFEKVASFGLLLNMILYLVNEYHMETAAGTSLLFLWSSLSSFLSIVGAYASDLHFGRFRVIGLVMLWATSVVPQAKPASCDRYSDSCKSPTIVQLAILVSSLVLLSIGDGCTRPCTTPFGADQLAKGEDPSNDEHDVLQSFFNWFYASGGISTILSLTLIVYIQDHFGWNVGFGVPTILMFLAAILFLLGSPLYVKVKPNNSGFIGAVDRVEALKCMFGVIPIWASGIIIFLNLSQAPILVLQAKTMDRHITPDVEIPPGSFTAITFLSLMISISLYECIISPFLDNHTKIGRLSPTARVGIGLVFTCLAMAAAALVENVRRKIAIEGVDGNPVLTMSATWLLPQLVLSGIADGISAAARIEYYYSCLPKSMSSIAMALFTLETAFSGLLGSLIVNAVNSVTSNGGKVSWLASDINEGRYDYYYALHGALGLINFLIFLVSCLVLRHSKEEKTTILTETEELKDNLL